MKKVLLLAINAKYVHSSLSVWVLAQAIKKYANGTYNVAVLETTINQEISEIINAITDQNPDVLCVSSYIWSANILPVILLKTKEALPNLKIILGGPEASNNPEFWLSNNADYVLKGEGEVSLPNLLDKINDLPELSNINLYNAHKKATDDILDPYTSEYLDSLNGRLAYIETSRGCPFSCAFCLSSNDSVRFFSLEKIKQQIEKLANSSAKTIKFVDRTFNCNSKRAFDLFEFCSGLKTNSKFHFEVAADLFDEKTLQLLEEIPRGKFQFEIGIQSFFEKTLEATLRKTDLAKVSKNIKRLLKTNNIHIHIDLIAGLPYETLREFKNSFNTAFYFEAHDLQLGFLKLLHGSELRNKADELGLIYSKEAPYEIISNSWLTEDDLKIIKSVENALSHTYNKGRFHNTLKYAMKVLKLKPFDFFYKLGATFPNHGTQLEKYANQIYSFINEFEDVEDKILLDHFLLDWLQMVKGKNAPAFLKPRLVPTTKQIGEYEKKLPHKYRRGEIGIKSDGTSIFVDNRSKDPVTGLYNVL